MCNIRNLLISGASLSKTEKICIPSLFMLQNKISQRPPLKLNQKCSQISDLSDMTAECFRN